MASITMDTNNSVLHSSTLERQHDGDAVLGHQALAEGLPSPPPVYSLTKSSTYQMKQSLETTAPRTFDSVDLEAQTHPHRASGLDEPEQNPDENRSALRLRGGCCCCDCLYDVLRCLLCCCIFEAICDFCC
ncbi:hypothetical protein MJO28_010764 [Puccinia striiformis f. sp. tritici]|uniref:Uncharacterized protein n=1 Tax=Puccinia striiformis f. sp. tritici TaxID=168172 RepID=A0ACC0E720_9BASI|nr:hypothetical protein Pst134EB_020459 [Puccinia striiformis f. sp. tritici]KAI7945069.1 hypothetical protein MJO28_010764 [Puccinia striiformis f. sp. tritici]